MCDLLLESVTSLSHLDLVYMFGLGTSGARLAEILCRKSLMPCPLLPSLAWVTVVCVKGAAATRSLQGALSSVQVQSGHLKLKRTEEASGLFPLAPSWLVSGVNFPALSSNSLLSTLHLLCQPG